jgi:glycine betaine catabolism B
LIEFETEIVDIIQRTHDVKSFRLKPAEGTDFKAGQFFSLTMNIKDKEVTKYFSFSSSPTEKEYIEFTKRITGSEFSAVLDKLKIGERLKIKMPFGNFTFNEEYKKVAFLSGGIGITPVRSICKYVVDKKTGTDMIIIYGNHTVKDIVFKDDFDLMQKEYPKLKVINVISKIEPGYKGRSGRIDNRIIKEEIIDYMERKFYICGPPAMVMAMKDMLLKEMGLAKENVITENFAGY